MSVRTSCQHRITPLEHERLPHHYCSHHMDDPACLPSPSPETVEQASRLRRLGRAIVRGFEAMGQAHSGYPYI